MFKVWLQEFQKIKGGNRMNFIEAVKAMKEGKKVRRDIWRGDIIYSLEGNIFKSTQNGDQNTMIRVDHIEATDWEIVEEKKTLSRKIIQDYRDMNGVGHVISVKNVKASLKEFIGFLSPTYPQIDEEDTCGHLTIAKAKEIFGDLVE